MRLSPLSSPEGALSSLAFIRTRVPKTFTIETFPFYGGELELNLSREGFNVRGITNKFVVNEFWQTLERDPYRLAYFTDFYQKKPIEDIMFYLQKEWFKERDPIIRSSLFALLQNSSDTFHASSGNYIKPSFDFNQTVKAWSPGQINIKFVNIEDEHIIDHLELDSRLLVFHGGLVTNELMDNSSCAIDETKVSNLQFLERMFTNYDPWLVNFRLNDKVIGFVGSKANIYFIDIDGEIVDKDEATRCIVTNV